MATIKGGEFLLRETKAEDIFITEDFSEEQQMMKESVREFIDKEVWPQKERFEKSDYGFTVEIMTKAAEMAIKLKRTWQL